VDRGASHVLFAPFSLLSRPCFSCTRRYPTWNGFFSPRPRTNLSSSFSFFRFVFRIRRPQARSWIFGQTPSFSRPCCDKQPILVPFSVEFKVPSLFLFRVFQCLCGRRSLCFSFFPLLLLVNPSLSLFQQMKDRLPPPYLFRCSSSSLFAIVAFDIALFAPLSFCGSK